MNNNYSYNACICFIYSQNDSQRIAGIERLALRDDPAMLVFIISSIAMIVMVIRLTYRVCWSLRYMSNQTSFRRLLNNSFHWLLSFPILFAHTKYLLRMQTMLPVNLGAENSHSLGSLEGDLMTLGLA